MGLCETFAHYIRLRLREEGKFRGMLDTHCLFRGVEGNLDTHKLGIHGFTFFSYMFFQG